MKVLEDMLRSLMAQRLKVNNKLQSWNDKNMTNLQLENQLCNLDMRIDYLLDRMERYNGK